MDDVYFTVLATTARCDGLVVAIQYAAKGAHHTITVEKD